jgi:pyruvate/2-oxoglutarate dehydrogenase complex dihydrolipoamide dehydrogenase (E3) component
MNRSEPAGVTVLVVGGGPAGATAALQASELRADVTLLEADRVGGTSLNRGPAPVRTLARAARLARDWSSWAEFGLEGPRPVPNLDAILANSTRVARYAHDQKRMGDHLRGRGIELLEAIGPVRFTDPHTLRAADGRRWRADRIILAVGGHAARLRIPGAELAITYEDIRTLRTLPATAAVVGAADTGCQIASILADLGTEVSLFEAGAVPLPGADASLSVALARAFQDRGIALHVDAFVEALQRTDERITVQYRSGSSAARTTVDAVFFAVGWPANIDELALEIAGVSAGQAAIPVDSCLRTNVEHIFAAGDVNGRSMLVQAARLEGRIAATNAVTGSNRQVTYHAVPSASFTDPEYGRVGLTEAEAGQDHEIEIGVAYYDDLLRPVADGRPDGFCKLIADRRRHRILGAHVLGEYSAEVIQVVAACMAADMRIEEVAELPFAYPTVTEGVSMAAQKICRGLGVGRFPQVWSDIADGESLVR